MSDLADASSADAWLHQWATSVAGDAAARVDLRLLELDGAPEMRGGGRPPLCFRLRYLVTTRGESTETDIGLLERLLLAARETPELDVELTPAPPALWLSLGRPPQPAFSLALTVRHDRPEPDTPRVRVPLVLQGGPIRSLCGRLVGPGDLPLPDARIEVLATHQSTRTGPDGRFAFAAVPVDSPTRFAIDAKGTAFVADVDIAQDDDDVLIRCNLLEV